MDKKYEVIHHFTDLRDYDHAYNVGDEFPRNGVIVSEERISELSSSRNKQRRPLIKAVEVPGNQKLEEQVTANPVKENVVLEPENPNSGDKPEGDKPVVTPDSLENPEQRPTADDSGNSKKYSKEDIEALKLNQIREIAGQLGFKISSTSKDGAVAEFMEKQG